jgi:hypothetical protein
MPLFVVFLKVIYPAAVPGLGLASWLRRRPPDKREIAARLDRLLGGWTARCPTALLNELTPVTLDDVRSWFDHNSIYDSEQRRHELAAAIFRSATARPLAEVELALQRIHGEFVRQVTRQQGSHAW